MTHQWIQRPLGDLLKIQNGYAFNSKSFSLTDGLPLIRIRDLKNGIKTETRFLGAFDSRYCVSSGDFLVGMDGEFGCYQWQGEPALLNQRVCKLTDFGSELLPKFLFYGINRYLKEIEEITGFTTVKHLSSKQIESIRFPVPPLSEQNRIVAILDQAFVGIDTAIANTEKNIANARELFDSYLTTVFNQHNAGSMKKSLSALCDKITVGHVGPMSSRYKNIGVPFLRSQNIRPFEVVMDGAVFIDDRFHLELKKSRLCPGDIAVVRTGYPGTAAVIPPWLEDANCSDLVIIRPSSEVNPQYLAAFFNSSFGKKLVLGRLVGAAQKHFNIGAAREVMLHYPSVQRQEQIVSELNVLRAETERLESLCQQKIAAYGRLKQSILQKAFAGELIAHPVKALQEAAE